MSSFRRSPSNRRPAGPASGAGAELEVFLEKPVAGGRMLARHEGRVVLVAGGIPGERVRAAVERIAKQVVFARVTRVVEASPDRRSGNVDWACGGNLLAHIAYPRQVQIKAELVADAFSRIAKFPLAAPVPVLESPETGYRMRGRLHAREGRFGFFREGSHEVCDAGATGQLLPATVECLAEVEAALRREGIEGVSSCELAENVAADERAILVEAMLPGALPHVPRVAGVSGLLFMNPADGRVVTAYGSPFVTDTVESGSGSGRLVHHVQSFFQANRYLISEMVRRVLAVAAGERVVELYAGVGLFAVSLAAQGRQRIVAVEGDRSGARDLEANAAPYRASLIVEQRSVEEFLSRSAPRDANTWVLDPPRTGVSAEALARLLEIGPSRIVYLSCDLATLARDFRQCADAGYQLDHIEAFDLFPNTPHVETLAVLRRR